MANVVQAPNLLFPESQAQMLAIQRQQAMAQMLMEQGSQQSDPYARAGEYVVPQSPLLGASKAIEKGLGAYMSKQADQKQMDMSTNQARMLASMLGGGQMQQQGAPPQVAQPQTPWINPDTQQLAEMPPAPSGGGQPQMPQQPQQPQQTGGFGPNGMPVDQRMLAYMMSPEAYTKTTIDQYSPTDTAKLAREAGGDPRAAAQAMMQKNAYIAPIDQRPGMLARDPITMQPLAYNPRIPENANPVFDASGNVAAVNPIQGTQQVMQQNAAANASGPAQFQIQNTVDPNSGAQIPTTSYNLARAINGQGQPMQGPQSMPPAPQAGAAPSGVSPQGSPPPLMTALPPGQAEGQIKVANANADRRNELVTQAKESPIRMNVLDNIIDLSKAGIQTGPGQEWKNRALGLAANTPGIQAMIPQGNKDALVGFQTMQKYLNQNGLRAWTAAGGTGTDAQLSASLKANPNDVMFPQALQHVAQWAKAGESALQAKANAQDAWVNTQGNHVDKLDKFEAQWRNNYDPRIFQLQMMEPQEQQKFVAGLKPEERQALIKKTQSLTTMGAF